KGGMGTPWYADVAEAIVPVLRPDLVIVAILQGDDLAQAVPLQPEQPESRGEAPHAPPWKKALKSVASLICPNFLQRRESAGMVPTASTIGTTWDKDAERRISRMNAQERAWFDHLDPTVAKLFRDGNLNPGLVTLALAEPDHLRMT